VGSTLALAQPHYYDRLVQLASTIKFVHQVVFGEFDKLLYIGKGDGGGGLIDHDRC
jgi:hypothetical protein